jgi:hypothetical protein
MSPLPVLTHVYHNVHVHLKFFSDDAPVKSMRPLLLLLAVASFHSLAFASDQPASGDPGSAAMLVALTDTTSEVAVNGPLGLLGIAWGNSPPAAKGAMTIRPGVTLVRETADELVYAGGTCAGLPVDTWRLRFENGCFYQAAVSFEFPVAYNDKGSVSDAITDALRRLIVQRYGIDGSNNSSTEHNLQTWSFAETPESKGTKLIQLNYNWQACVIILTYTNQYYQSLANPAKVTPGDL